MRGFAFLLVASGFTFSCTFKDAHGRRPAQVKIDYSIVFYYVNRASPQQEQTGLTPI